MKKWAFILTLLVVWQQFNFGQESAPNNPQAKRKVQFIVSYDVPPSEGLAPATIEISDKEKREKIVIQGSKELMPGAYEVCVVRDGYQSITQQVEIVGGKGEFALNFKLMAKSRLLSIEILYNIPLSPYAHVDVCVRPYRVLVNDKNITATDTFAPGQKYKLTVQFHEYKTVEKDIIIPPGEVPFVAAVELIKLDKYEFRVGKKYADQQGGMFLDGIRYNLEIYMDGALVEPYRIQFEGAPGGLMYGSYYAPKDATTVRIVAGFYSDDSIIKPQVQFRNLRKIDMPRLVGHLSSLAKNVGFGKALHALKILLKTKEDAAKIKDAKQDDMEKLSCFLRGMELTSDQEQALRNNLLQELQEHK